MRNIVFFGLLFLISFSCDNKDKNGNNKKDDKLAHKATKVQLEAKAIIDFRIKEQPEVPAVIESNFWKYVFIFENGEMSEAGQHDGRWIDFKMDNTYEYGFYEKTDGSGRFHHNFEKERVIMLDDDLSKQPKEFETIFGGDLLILVGKPTFGNNGTQMKLERIANKPVK